MACYSMMGQPMMGQPMMGQPMMGQPMMGQPMIGQVSPMQQQGTAPSKKGKNDKDKKDKKKGKNEEDLSDDDDNRKKNKKEKDKKKKDKDDDDDDSGSNEYDSDTDRPICEYGKNCFRKNPDHKKTYSHKNVRKKKDDKKNKKDKGKGDPWGQGRGAAAPQQGGWGYVPPQSGRYGPGFQNVSSSSQSSSSSSPSHPLTFTPPSMKTTVSNSAAVATTDMIIREMGEGNLTYTPTDFCKEFEGIFNRRATPNEVGLFLRHQRAAKENVAAAAEGVRGKGNGEEVPREYAGYVFMEYLGGGGYGKVYKAQHRLTKAIRAVKVIPLVRADEDEGIKKGGKQQAVDGETKIGTEYGKRCLFLVDYEQVTVLRSECLVLMEYCPGGDLRALIDTRIRERTLFQEKDILRFLVEMGLAVQTLHSADIVHRDIKPQNIFLVRNGSCKLGDYGTARFITGEETMSLAGTTGYIAPEILEGERRCEKGVDIYALGCIAIEMMELQHPFKNESGNLNIVNVSMGRHNAMKSTQYSADLVGLIKSMISVDVSKRPSIANVLAFPPVITFLTSFYTAVLKKEIEG